MFENDSIQAFHDRKPKKPVKMQAMGLPSKEKRDDFIMDTNNSSIVSKRSVEKLYYKGQTEYFRYFVRKFQRRAPLINRGYWLRMRAIDHTVRTFLTEENGKHKVVINLGCGYDPLPFQYLGNSPKLCHNCTFVDVDYPQLMQRKLQVIQQHEALHGLLKDMELGKPDEVRLLKANGYRAYGCDLGDLDKFDSTLRKDFSMESCAVAFLFVAEVSVAYMEMEPANKLMRWAARLEDARFCLLEQHLPDGANHPFAKTMLKHFEKLRAPLRAIGTLEQMEARLTSAGWPQAGVDIRSLWNLWSDPSFLTPQQRQELDEVEPFDEWEEFALFGQHYFLLVANNSGQRTRSEIPNSSTSLAESGRTLYADRIGGKDVTRRFAASAVVHGSLEGGSSAVVVDFAGLGSRERQKDFDLYSTTSDSRGCIPPQVPAPLMCHTITPCGIGSKQLLLVGGRTSPDKASKACWLLEDNFWRQVHDLPEGRFRHCAIPVKTSTAKNTSDAEGFTGVLIGCGKNSHAQVLDDWLLWSDKRGWIPVEVLGNRPMPRFGAAMSIPEANDNCEGVLVGGMTQDGVVIDDCWEWTLGSSDGRPNLSFFKTNHHHVGFQHQTSPLARFGATIVNAPGISKMLLVGGIASKEILRQDLELYDLATSEGIHLQTEERPFFVGFSAQSLPSSRKETSDILVLGGGSTCFSFGTCWGSSFVLRAENKMDEIKLWQSLAAVPVSTATGKSKTIEESTAQDTENQSQQTESVKVSRRTIHSAADFEQIRKAANPVIIEGLEIGECTASWTTEYLRDKVGADRKVVIHDSPSPHMNFQAKNFSYTTTTFGQLLDYAINGSHVYLRALSAEKPSEKVTHLAEDFPTISEDFRLPPELEYAEKNAHSSPLRISGAVTMWLHYDVMANVLCQIRGKKRLLLYPPSDVTKLSFGPGASSSTINPFTASTTEHPELLTTNPHVAELNPGDVLFLPPLWLHAAEPTEGLSIAVNVFFRDDSMENSYAAGKDVYGNRDLAMYERGRRDIQRIGKSFEGLPQQVKTFYLSRLAEELRSMALTQ